MLKVLKHQVLDLQNKFDYFILMQIKSGELEIDDFQSPPTSPTAATFNSAEFEEEKAGAKLKTQVQDFADASKMWDLGNRSHLYRESRRSAGLGPNWLARLQELSASHASESPSEVLRDEDKQTDEIDVRAEQVDRP